jgi:Mce-associated membrane protein
MPTSTERNGINSDRVEDEKEAASTGPEMATATAQDKSDTDHTELPSEAAGGDSPKKSAPKRLRISVSLRGLGIGLIAAALVAAVGVMTWLYIGSNSSLDALKKQDADSHHAEQVALDYAVNAAIMDYKDLGPWKQNLVKGTTPELNDKLTKAATEMEQILLPMQWSSTAKPLAAKVRSQQNGVYVVDAFVSVMTKTVQAADSLQSTATYSVTVDSSNAWKISDVGGIASVVGEK